MAKRLRAYNDLEHAAAWLAETVGGEWAPADVVDAVVRFGVRLYVWLEFEPDDPRPIPHHLKDGAYWLIAFSKDLRRLCATGRGRAYWAKAGETILRFSDGQPFDMDEVKITSEDLLSLADRLKGESAEIPTREARVSDASVTQNIPRRDRQINLIVKAASELGYNPLEVPNGGKQAIKDKCQINEPSLFSDAAFEHAWSAARKRNAVKMKDHAKYTR
jgi:hypothetical protein